MIISRIPVCVWPICRQKELNACCAPTNPTYVRTINVNKYYLASAISASYYENWTADLGQNYLASWLKLHNSWNQALIELENCQIFSGVLLLRPSTEGLNSYRQPSFRFYLYISSSPAPTIKLQSSPTIIDVLEFRLTKERIETQTPDQFYPLLIRHLWPELWASEPFAQGIRKRHLGIQKRR